MPTVAFTYERASPIAVTYERASPITATYSRATPITFTFVSPSERGPSLQTLTLTSGITSSEAFGAPSVVPEQFIGPTGISSGEAFGSPATNAGIRTQSITSSESFGSTSVKNPNNLVGEALVGYAYAE